MYNPEPTAGSGRRGLLIPLAPIYKTLLHKKKELVTIYTSLVLPHFNYCSTIWNDNNKTHIDKLWKLQKFWRAARVITSSDYTIRLSPVFETLQWHPIKNLMSKVVKNIAPNYLTNMFRKCDNSNYSLRSNNLKLSLPRLKTDFLKRSFSYRGALSLGIVYPTSIYFFFSYSLIDNYYETL